MNQRKKQINVVLCSSENILEYLKVFLSKHYERNWKFVYVDSNTFKVKNKLGEGLDSLTENNWNKIYPIKTAIAYADKVFIVTEPDDEGEAMAYNLKNVVLKYSEASVRSFKLYEITDNHTMLAFSVNEEIDPYKAMSWLTREHLYNVLDQKIEVLLQNTLNIHKDYLKKLHKDPVTLTVLDQILKKEKEVQSSTNKTVFYVEAEICRKKAKARSLGFLTEKEAQKHLDYCIEAKDNNRIKADFASKRHPVQVQKPFLTQTLIEQAYKKFGYEPAETLGYLKEMYEKGYLTYYKTKSLSLNRHFAERLWKYNRQNGKKVLDNVRNYSDYNKFKRTGEILRPVQFITPEEFDKLVELPYARLYRLIWNRTLKTQLKQTYVNLQSVDYSDGENLLFTADGGEISYQGCSFYPINQTLNENTIRIIDDFCIRSEIIPVTGRYTKVDIYKWMDETEVTHPNKYEQIIENLVESKFIKIDKNGKITITPLGELVIYSIKSISKDLWDSLFCSQLEEDILSIKYSKIEPKLLIENYKSLADKLIEKKNSIHVNEWSFLPRACPYCGTLGKLETDIIVLVEPTIRVKCKNCDKKYELIAKSENKITLRDFDRKKDKQELYDYDTSNLDLSIDDYLEANKYEEDEDIEPEEGND
jgi:DNA topoisomerase IA